MFDDARSLLLQYFPTILALFHTCKHEYITVPIVSKTLSEYYFAHPNDFVSGIALKRIVFHKNPADKEKCKANNTSNKDEICISNYIIISSF